MAAGDAFTERTAATRAEVEARIAAVAPELDALQAELKRQRDEGLIAPEEASRRMRARHAEVFAPFSDKLDAADAAEEQAFARNAEEVSQADALSRAEGAGVGVPQPEPSFCRIDDPSCGSR